MSQTNPSLGTTGETGVVEALERQDLSIATTLGKYRLIGALGHGGMADVYLAVADGPEGFRKLCVLKVLKDSMVDDEDFRAMFLDEARLAARLNHPNVVQTFEIGDTNGRLMLAMEYVDGQPISRLRRRLTPAQLPVTAYVSVLCDVLEALDYAHGLADFNGGSLGVVHRDVSPHNIILAYDGSVKLLDFGIAKSSAAVQMTQAGVLKGKVGYMAPEQASLRDVDGRADVFSVGVILWEAIAGRRLAEGISGNAALVRRIEGNDPKITEIVPDVDPELARICDRALARRPDDRFASAAELQAVLQAWLAKQPPPNRKELAKALRDAFESERKQLRALVEQRMADDSGMRPFSGVTGVTGSGSIRAAALGESSMPRALTPSTGILANAASTESAFAPPPPRRNQMGLVVGVVAAVVLSSATATFVMLSQKRQAPAPAASTEQVVPREGPANANANANGATTPANVDVTPESAPTPAATPSATASSRQARPVFVYPTKAPPVVVRPNTPANAANPASPAPAPAPTPAKPQSRPLDEKDPYAQ